MKIIVESFHPPHVNKIQIKSNVQSSLQISERKYISYSSLMLMSHFDGSMQEKEGLNNVKKNGTKIQSKKIAKNNNDKNAH